MAPKKKARTSASSSGSGLPKWTSKDLSLMPREHQQALYFEKLEKKAKNLEDIVIAERTTTLDDFRNYGLVEGFERLGWTAALTINSAGNHAIYLDELTEWMSTLERENGENPPWTTTLTGTVGGVPVEMSMDSLRTIANFDTLDQQEYAQVSDGFLRGTLKGEGWYDMLRELFDVPEELLSESRLLEVDNLKPLPKLILRIATWNVVPRKSDKKKVRTSDIRPLFALVTGRLRYPFCQQLMLNIWDSRESPQRATVPHCRVISQLLVNAGVIGRGSKPKSFPQKFFDRDHLGRGEFAFKENHTQFLLYDLVQDRVWTIPKPTVAEGHDPIGMEFEHYGAREPSGLRFNRPASYPNWTEFERMSWDNNQYHFEDLNMRARRMQESQVRFEDGVNERLDQIRQHVEVQGLYQQMYQNRAYEHAEQERHWQDFIHGRPYQAQTAWQDFSTMRQPEAGGSSHLPPPYPQMTPPDWYRNYDAGASSSSQPPRQQPEEPNVFDTRDMARGLFESFFGPPR